LVYNGLDTIGRPSASLWQEPLRIACLGRLTRDKGFDVALAAFAEARKTLPSLRMTVAGDGPEFGNLAALARQLNIDEAVDFPGWIAPADVSHLLNSAAIVVVPSRVPESFGLVALEAMLMGRPVIAADSGALSELVVDGETGIVTSAEDFRAMATVIVRLLAHRESAERMGVAGRQRAIERFSFERYVNEYEALYVAAA
jgi:glycosyltransferase involved in cell wall biosynthesis